MQMATLAQTHDISRSGTQQPWESTETCVLGMNAERVARGLGWFSIGLGVAELFAPGAVARLVGSRNHKTLLRSYGLREIGAGIGILTRQQQLAPFVWARVAGDMVDLASLGGVLAGADNRRGPAVASIAAVAGVTLLDALTAQALSKGAGRSGPMHAEASMAINASADDCYAFWHDFENLPKFMDYLQSVRITGDRTSHWIAKGPGNVRLEWDAETLEDVPGDHITWRSLPGSPIYNSGSVQFHKATAGHGSIIRVQLDYQGGPTVAAPLAKIIGKDPEQLIYKDLRRFKQVIETGEVLRTEGQPSGRNDEGATWLDRIAR
jgi:uncharacterized membrane protein